MGSVELGVLSAYDGDQRVGGAVLAYKTDGVTKLEGRDDVAALWDLRVAPRYRRQGVGTKLFRAASAWSRERGCRWFKIETQNINVPACRFYAAQGCALGEVNLHAYRELPGEIELVWYLEVD